MVRDFEWIVYEFLHENLSRDNIYTFNENKILRKLKFPISSIDDVDDVIKQLKQYEGTLSFNLDESLFETKWTRRIKKKDTITP